MPAEDVSPNLDDPKVRAAMKLLGVRVSDLEAVGGEAQQSDGEVRKKLLQQKQKKLLDDVHSVAHNVPSPHHIDAQSDAGQSRNTAFLAEVLEIEQANLQRLQRHAKKDIQKIVINELEAKLQMEQGAKKTAESQAMMKELQKARAADMQTAKKEALKRGERAHDARERARRDQEQEAQELTKSLKAATQRAEQKLEKLAEEQREQNTKNEEKRLQISNRQSRKEQQERAARERAYIEMETKHQARTQKLENMLAERDVLKDELAAKLERSMSKVRSHQTLKQAEADRKYKEALARHEKATSERDALIADLRKDLRSKNNKAANSHQQRYDRVVQENENMPPSRRLVRSASETIRSTPTSPFVESAKTMVDLVTFNQTLSRRARTYEQEKAFNKIRSTRERSDLLSEAKREANQRRYQTMKTCALEKMHLADKVDKVRSANPAMLTKLITELDPEPAAAERINTLLKGLSVAPLLIDGKAEDEAER